jgi:hypothetical protein
LNCCWKRNCCRAVHPRGCLFNVKAKKLTRHTANSCYQINPLLSEHARLRVSSSIARSRGSWGRERNRSRSNGTHPHTSLNLDQFNNYYLHHHYYYLSTNTQNGELTPPLSRCKILQVLTFPFIIDLPPPSLTTGTSRPFSEEAKSEWQPSPSPRVP